MRKYQISENRVSTLGRIAELLPSVFPRISSNSGGIDGYELCNKLLEQRTVRHMNRIISPHCLCWRCLCCNRTHFFKVFLQKHIGDTGSLKKKSNLINITKMCLSQMHTSSGPPTIQLIQFHNSLGSEHRLCLRCSR